MYSAERLLCIADYISQVDLVKWERFIDRSASRDL
jgi:hypothetical protein